MKHLFILIMAGLFVIGFNVLHAESTSEEAIKQMLSIPSRVIIDVRTQTEYDESHIDEAILIPFDQIEDRITHKVPEKMTPIILYCRSGRRSEIAKATLEKIGYRQVFNAGSYESLKKVYVKPQPKKKKKGAGAKAPG